MSVKDLLNAVDNMSHSRYVKIVNGNITLYKVYDTSLLDTSRRLTIEDVLFSINDSSLLEQMNIMFEIHKSDDVKYILCINTNSNKQQEFLYNHEDLRELLYGSLYYLNSLRSMNVMIPESFKYIYSDIIKRIMCLPNYYNYTGTRDEFYSLLDCYYLGKNEDTFNKIKDAVEAIRINEIMIHRLSIIKFKWDNKNDILEICKLSNACVVNTEIKLELSKDLAKALLYDLRNVIIENKRIIERVYGDYIIDILYDSYNGNELMELIIKSKGYTKSIKFSSIALNINILNGIEEVLERM